MKKHYNKKKHPYLADNLRVVRALAGKTQADIEADTGIERTAYAYWEIGRCEPSLDRLMTLIDYYNSLCIPGLDVDYNTLLLAPISYTIQIQKEKAASEQSR